MAKTKFFRVAVEGATTDGRVIERGWIEDMAAGYNPETYTARINCEHIAGYSPQPPFNAYGTVLAVKAEEITLQLNGKPEKRLALFAQFDVNDQLVEINRAGQKLFTSIEVTPNFAATGKAGLVGLAVTDNPASLGTEMLAFSAAKPMIATFKTKPDSLISESVELTLELEDAPADDGSKGAFAALTGLLQKLTGSAPTPPVTPPTAPPAPATPPPANDNFAQLSEGLGVIGASIVALNAKVDGLGIAALSAKVTALETAFAGTEAPGFRRDPATGSGAGSYAATDC
ncbi:MAG: GPO family capsid scaffolding protein [Rhizorhabdus sp.]